MELHFDDILELNIKRLTWPQFDHTYTQLNDLALTSNQTPQDIMHPTQIFYNDRIQQMNDISYDGLTSDMQLSYHSKFGKIYKGE